MPTGIQFIHKGGRESEEQVCNEEEIAVITFSYLQKGIGLFNKLGYILVDNQAFRYSQRDPIYFYSIYNRKHKFTNNSNAYINIEKDTINSG